MIKAVYNRQDHLLTVEGHAYSGEPGHDLVCASASILAYTFAANLEYLSELDKVTDTVSEFADGRAVIGGKARKGYESIVTMVFDSVCEGFALLSGYYPDNITFTVDDVEAQ